MSLYTTAIFQGQMVPNGAAAKLSFGTSNPVLNGLSVVPANCVVLLTSLYLNNLTAAVQTLQLWRGTAATAAFALGGVGTAINVPPSTITQPGFQALSAPIVLMPGDSIWALAGAASVLNVTGDGQVIVQ